MKKYRLFKFYGLAPVWTLNSVGDLLASVTASHTGALQTFTADFTGVMTGQIQIKNLASGTVAGTNGCQVSVYRIFTTNTDNVPIFQFTIISVVSTSEFASIELPSGKYSVTLKNLDTTNDITVVATSNTLSWPS